MIFRGGLNDLSIPLSISSTLRRHNFFSIDAIIYSHKIRSRVDAAASMQGCIDASLPKWTFHLQMTQTCKQSETQHQTKTLNIEALISLSHRFSGRDFYLRHAAPSSVQSIDEDDRSILIIREKFSGGSNQMDIVKWRHTG